MISSSYDVDCDGLDGEGELREAHFRYEPVPGWWGDTTGLVNQMEKRGWTYTHDDPDNRIRCFCPLRGGSVVREETPDA